MEMNEERTYHLIDQYLNGELSGRDLDNFKARLKDPEFAKQVEIQRQIMETIMDERKAELKRYISENSKVNYIKNSWGNTWTYASAAIVILFVSAFFIIKSFDNSNSEQQTVTIAPEAEISEEPTDTTATDSNMLAIETPTSNDMQTPDIQESPVEIHETENEEVSEEALTDNFSEMDDDQFKADGRPEVAETTTVKRAEIGEEFDAEVKKDKKLSSKSFSVVQLRPDFTEKDQAASDEVLNIDTAGNDKQELKYKEVSTRTLSVEYWESPVGFNGYKYNYSSLALYGVDKDEAISFKELDNRLYLKRGSKFYHLEKNGSYNKFVAVINPTLLKVLND